MKRIYKAGGTVGCLRRINGDLELSRAIGDLWYKNTKLRPKKQMVTAFPDVQVHEMSDDDEFLILACDGM
jgi:protein phosphatase PTC2/3